MAGTLQRNRLGQLLPAGFPEFDNLFNHFFRAEEAGMWRAPASIWEADNSFHIEIDAPGVFTDLRVGLVDVQLAVEVAVAPLFDLLKIDISDRLERVFRRTAGTFTEALLSRILGLLAETEGPQRCMFVTDDPTDVSDLPRECAAGGSEDIHLGTVVGDGLNITLRSCVP